MSLVPASAGGPPSTSPILCLPTELVTAILSRLLVFGDDEIHLCYNGSFYLGAASNVGKNTLAILRTCRTLYRTGSALFFQKNVFNMREPVSETPQSRSADFPPQFCSAPLSPKSLRTIRRMVVVRILDKEAFPHMTRMRMPGDSDEAAYPAHYKSSFAIQALVALGADLDSLTLAFAYDVYVWIPSSPLAFWETCFDCSLHSYASEALPALRRLLLQGRLKTLSLMAYHERSKQFDEYQLAVTCVSRILTSAGLAAPWAQMDWGHSVPESAAAYEVDTGLPVHLLTFADLMPGFTMTTSSWGLYLAHNEWRNGIIGKGLVSKTVIRKDRSHGTTAQISRARLSRELRALLSQSGVDYLEDLPQPDMVDHDKVRALLDDWRSDPSIVIDLPPPTGELLEAVGDGPEPWQAALLAGVEDCLPFNPYVHYLCCAVSNCHLKEIRPQDLDWLVEGYKELVLFRESRRENWYNKWIPDYFGPAPTGP